MFFNKNQTTSSKIKPENKKPLLEHKEHQSITEKKEENPKPLKNRRPNSTNFRRRQWSYLTKLIPIPRNIGRFGNPPTSVLGSDTKALEALKIDKDLLQKLGEAENKLNQEAKKEELPSLEAPIEKGRKEQSRFRKFIIKHFNNPEKAKRKDYKAEIKKTLENFDTLPPNTQRQLKAFQYYYNIKPQKKKRTSFQSWNKKMKATLDYIEQVSAFVRNVAIIGQRIAVPSSMHAAVQASAQTSATVASAALEATGVGLGAVFIPIQILDSLRSIKKAIRSKENYDYANLYLKQHEQKNGQKLPEIEKELLSAARYLRNKQKYWNKRLDAVDAVQGLVSTALTTACALVAAIVAPIFPILTPIIGGIGIGFITGSLGITVGISTFKKSKGTYNWTKAKAAKKAYENPEGIFGRKARRQAFKEYKIENNLTGKNIKLKNLSPAARTLLENEISIRAKEMVKNKHIQYSGKFAAKNIHEKLCREQVVYHNDKRPTAALVEGPVVGFLKHFNIEEGVIKAIIDCPDERTAQKLLRNEMKKGISNLGRKEIEKALQEAKEKRQQAKTP